MAFGIKPLLDNIIVREHPYVDYQLLAKGIATPEDKRKNLHRGEVVAVGDGIPMGGVLVPMPVAVGDVVDYSEYGVEQVWEHPRDRFDNTKPTYYRVRVADVYGVVSAS